MPKPDMRRLDLIGRGKDHEAVADFHKAREQLWQYALEEIANKAAGETKEEIAAFALEHLMMPKEA